ncbi:MAG: hypothetical protein QM704_24560 [Anaeromyxobacteraceae bacterium]
MIPTGTTPVVREGVERARSDIAARISPLGFARTFKGLWTRPHALTIDWVSVDRHGSSYGAPLTFSVDLRLQLGIDLLDGPMKRGAWGPSSDPAHLRAGRYHLRFNARSGSTYERCIDDLARFVSELGEPWFARLAAPEALVAEFVAQQVPDARERMDALRSGRVDAATRAATLEAKGVKAPAC